MQFEAGGAKSNWSDSQHPQHFPPSTYSPPISSPAPTVSNNNNPSPAKSEPPQEPPGTQQSHPSSPGGFKQWAPSPSADLLAPFHSYDQHQAAQNLNYYMYLQSQVHVSFWLNSKFCLLSIQILSSGLIVCHHAGYEHGVPGFPLPGPRIPAPSTEPPFSALPSFGPGRTLIENPNNHSQILNTDMK